MHDKKEGVWLAIAIPTAILFIPNQHVECMYYIVQFTSAIDKHLLFIWEYQNWVNLHKKNRIVHAIGTLLILCGLVFFNIKRKSSGILILTKLWNTWVIVEKY